MLCPLWISGQDNGGEALLARVNSGAYKTVERSDWSRYDNGKYSGHVYREVRATLNPRTADNVPGWLYQGNFFVLEETLRDLQQSARAVDEVVPVSFQIFPDGNIRIADDCGFPSLRGFPVFPAEPVRPGSKWTAPGVRVVDPLNEGFPVTVRFLAEYEYRGLETYRDVPVYRIAARYASRYQAAGNRGERYFRTLQGTHAVEILLRVSDGLPFLIRDNLDETFSWSGGATVRFRGFTLTFGEGTVPLNPDRVIASIGPSLGSGGSGGAAGSGGSPGSGGTGGSAGSAGGGRAVPSAVPAGENGGAGKTDWGKDVNIDLAAVPGGVRLTVRDIRFAPDSEEFLAVEFSRLDKIAEALKQAPDRTFLVEGHTAAVGRPDGEMDLSVRRARRFVEEMAGRGIDAARFMYKGWGGARPLGDNATEEGRSLNRRVEITIME